MAIRGGAKSAFDEAPGLELRGGHTHSVRHTDHALGSTANGAASCRTRVPS